MPYVFYGIVIKWKVESSGKEQLCHLDRSGEISPLEPRFFDSGSAFTQNDIKAVENGKWKAKNQSKIKEQNNSLGSFC